VHPEAKVSFLVDSKDHTEKYGSIDTRLNNLFESSNPYKPVNDVNDTNAGVVIYNLNEKEVGKDPYYVAVFPYHMEQGKALFAYNKLFGWSMIAQSDIYLHAKCAHMIQQVSIFHHGDTAFLIVDLSQDNKYELLSYVLHKPLNVAVDSVDFQKIALLDYLLNHINRTSNNTMISKELDHKQVRICADGFSLQYEITPKKVGLTMSKESWLGNEDDDLPADYIQYTALSQMLPLIINPDDEDELADWWLDVADQVKSSMNENLALIKDESLRQHIQNNFNQRWNVLYYWASLPIEVRGSIFDDSHPNKIQLEINKINLGTNSKVLADNLPSSPNEKIAELLRIHTEHGYKVSKHVQSIAEHICSSYSPELMAQIYLNFNFMPKLNWNSIIRYWIICNSAEDCKELFKQINLNLQETQDNHYSLLNTWVKDHGGLNANS
jgi:hypothetical protein